MEYNVLPHEFGLAAYALVPVLLTTIGVLIAAACRTNSERDVSAVETGLTSVITSTQGSSTKVDLLTVEILIADAGDFLSDFRFLFLL